MIVVRHQRHHLGAVGAGPDIQRLPCCRSDIPCRLRTAPARRPPSPWRSLSPRMRRSRILTPIAIVKLRSRRSRSPSGRKAPSVMSKSPLRLTRENALARAFDDRGEDVAVLVEALFRDHDQTALMLTVGMARASPSRSRDSGEVRVSGTRKSSVPSGTSSCCRIDAELGDAMIALEADGGDAVLDVEALRRRPAISA